MVLLSNLTVTTIMILLFVTLLLHEAYQKRQRKNHVVKMCRNYLSKRKDVEEQCTSCIKATANETRSERKKNKSAWPSENLVSNQSLTLLKHWLGLGISTNQYSENFDRLEKLVLYNGNMFEWYFLLVRVQGLDNAHDYIENSTDHAHDQIENSTGHAHDQIEDSCRVFKIK